MADMLKFYKGNLASLPAAGASGALYVTVDEGAIYLGTGTSMKRLGDFIQVSDVASLPATGANTNALYYCVSENVLAKYDGSGWTQINKQPTAAELKTLLGLKALAYKDKVAYADIDTDLKTKIDDASAANHSHTNKTVLDGITSEKVSAWDAAETNAKTYADGLNEAMDVRMTSAENKLTTLTGADTVEGSVAKALKDAKAYVDSLDTAMDARMDAVEGSITTLTGEENVAGSVKAIAKSYADGKDAAIVAAKKAGDDAQADVDTLAGKVGIVANDKTVVGLIGEAKAAADTAKAAADAAQSDVNALKAKVGTVTEGKTVVQMIKEAQTAATYDDTQIKADIKANADAIGILNGSGEGSVSKQVADAVASIVADAPEAYNTLKEISDWISSHASDASAMNSQINTNKTDIASLTALVGTLPETATSSTVVGYINEAIDALKIGDYAKADDLTAAINRISTAEGKITTLEGQVATINGDASTAGSIAKASADTLASAKSYADGLNTTMGTRVKALEDDIHTHDNKALLDTYTQTEADLADAVAKKHSHINATVLNGITAEKVSGWDSAETNAKAYTDELANGQVKTNKEAIASLNTSKADKATTLAGYGIADAYTKAEVESMLTWGSF